MESTPQPQPDQNVTHASEKVAALQVLLKWMASQPLANLLLFGILGFGFYAIKWVVPEHLKAIQQGYERMEESHKNERDSNLQLFLRALERKVTASDDAP